MLKNLRVGKINFNDGMKTKLILVIAFAFLVHETNGQSIGFKGGINLANMSFTQNGVGYSPESLTGFQLGPVADFKLVKNLYLNTGFLYSLKGYNLNSPVLAGTEGVFLNGKVKLSYLDIPLNLAYKFPLIGKSKFFIQGGPYMGLGLGGSVKIQTTPETPIQDVYSYNYLHNFDFGVGAGAGFEFGPLVASVNYELGISNLNLSTTLPGTYKNKALQFSIAYMFWNFNK